MFSSRSRRITEILSYSTSPEPLNTNSTQINRTVQKITAISSLHGRWSSQFDEAYLLPILQPQFCLQSPEGKSSAQRRTQTLRFGRLEDGQACGFDRGFFVDGIIGVPLGNLLPEPKELDSRLPQNLSKRCHRSMMSNETHVGFDIAAGNVG